MELYVSDEYLQVQAELVEAEMTYQTQRQALLEELLKSAQMPTLTDFDDLSHSLYRLGKRVRTLEQAVERLEQAGHDQP